MKRIITLLSLNAFCLLISSCQESMDTEANDIANNIYVELGDSDSFSFTVADPEVMYDFEEIYNRELRIDCPISAVNDNGTWKFFSWFHGFKYATGTRAKPFGQMIIYHGPLKGAPDPRILEFRNPADDKYYRVYDFPEGLPEGLKLGNASYAEESGACYYWLGNVWRIPESGNLLGFYHVEQLHPDCIPKIPPISAYVYFVLGISKDEGETWNYCGRIMEHDKRYNYEWFLKEKQINLSGMPCVVKNGEYLQIYYTDFAPSDDGQKIKGIAVMRARIDDVVREAEKEQPTAAPWFKYYNGQWTEPGIGGKWTKIGPAAEGALHGDAAYNSYLDCYMIVSHRHTKRGAIVLAFSKDGLNWSEWQTAIYKNDHDRRYPSIVSMGDDNEVTGQSFWIYYERYNSALGTPMNPNGYDFERVKVTLNKE